MAPITTMIPMCLVSNPRSRFLFGPCVCSLMLTLVVRFICFLAGLTEVTLTWRLRTALRMSECFDK